MAFLMSLRRSIRAGGDSQDELVVLNVEVVKADTSVCHEVKHRSVFLLEIVNSRHLSRLVWPQNPANKPTLIIHRIRPIGSGQTAGIETETAAPSCTWVTAHSSK